MMKNPKSEIRNPKDLGPRGAGVSGPGKLPGRFQKNSPDARLGQFGFRLSDFELNLRSTTYG
jgi:hypothetical protein